MALIRNLCRSYPSGLISKILLTSILASILLSHTAIGDTSVWKISKGEQHLYIGGTVHVLQADDYPLPIEFDQAYSLSQKLVFETDISATAKPELVQSLLAEGRYSDGRSLASYLKPETLNNFRAYLKRNDLDINQILSFKVGMVMMILSSHELQKLKNMSDGVDKHFSLKAHADAKAMGTSSEGGHLGNEAHDLLVAHCLVLDVLGLGVEG